MNIIDILDKSSGKMNKNLEKKLYLPSPRGFCAGVERAIKIVELCSKKYDNPIFVKHEIVHNPWVINNLKNIGVTFVEDLNDIPEGSKAVFSAHGVSKSTLSEAKDRNIPYIDATCPLVLKVHNEAIIHHKGGAHIFLIGHSGHPEVEGTIGQVPKGSISLIENMNDVKNLKPSKYGKTALITQTTLSVDDTKEIVEKIKKLFPDIILPSREDICYATTNRQGAVKSIAKKCDILYVIGAENSSNSLRLVEVAKKAGCVKTFLISKIDEVDWQLVGESFSIGLTASASAPEILIEEFISAIKNRYEVEVIKNEVASENISFKIPKELTG